MMGTISYLNRRQQRLKTPLNYVDSGILKSFGYIRYDALEVLMAGIRLQGEQIKKQFEEVKKDFEELKKQAREQTGETKKPVEEAGKQTQKRLQ